MVTHVRRGKTTDAQQTPNFRRTVHAARERQGFAPRAARPIWSWPEAERPGDSKKGEQADVQRRRANHTPGTVLQANHRYRAKERWRRAVRANSTRGQSRAICAGEPATASERHGVGGPPV